VQAIQNAATAKVYGLQASINVMLTDHFTFSTDLNVQKGEEELDDGSVSPSRHAAPFFGTSGIGYKASDLNLLLYLDFQGERAYEDMSVEERDKDEIYAKDENGNNYAPSWATLNFKAFYELSDLFSVSAGLENITDERYRPYSSGVSGPGRNFFISLRTNI
jgi:hemoglobin/transferrin/lactoferrin receptor protein